jgi:hypothetical protein
VLELVAVLVGLKMRVGVVLGVVVRCENKNGW